MDNEKLVLFLISDYHFMNSFSYLVTFKILFVYCRERKCTWVGEGQRSRERNGAEADPVPGAGAGRELRQDPRP